jgi:putative FmdB family regulatory protein
MPTYSYQCVKCEHAFDARHSMSAPAPGCPACHGEVRKVFTAPAVLGGGTAGSSPSASYPSNAGSACGCGKPHGGCH